MNEICIHAYVSGRVQGVWYRQSTKDKAKKLGLTGWVKNLSDGRVELMACGDRVAVNDLAKWLWKGPIAAKVNDVVVEEVPFQVFEDFEFLAV